MGKSWKMEKVWMTPLRTRSDILSSPLSRWYIYDQSPAAVVSITTIRHVCEQEEGL